MLRVLRRLTTSKQQHYSNRFDHFNHFNHNESKVLSSQYEKLYESGDKSDFEITSSDGKVFKVHSFILKLNSAYFAGLFNTKMTEIVDGKMKISNIPSKYLDDILRYIYYRATPIYTDDDSNIEMLRCVDMLGLDEYFKSIKINIIKSLRSDNKRCIKIVNKLCDINLIIYNDIIDECVKLIVSDIKILFRNIWCDDYYKPDGGERRCCLHNYLRSDKCGKGYCRYYTRKSKKLKSKSSISREHCCLHKPGRDVFDITVLDELSDDIKGRIIHNSFYELVEEMSGVPAKNKIEII